MNHLQKSYRPDPPRTISTTATCPADCIGFNRSHSLCAKNCPGWHCQPHLFPAVIGCSAGHLYFTAILVSQHSLYHNRTRHYLDIRHFYPARKTHAAACSAMQHHCANAVLQIYRNDFSAAARLRQHADSAISQKRGCSGTLYAICRFILPCCTGGISCSMNTPSKSCDTRQKTSGC